MSKVIKHVRETWDGLFFVFDTKDTFVECMIEYVEETNMLEFRANDSLIATISGGKP